MESKINNAKLDEDILNCSNWEDLEVLINSQKVSKIKGDLFERFVQLYLLNQPEYRTTIDKVWKLDEVPLEVLDELNLTRNDFGIDLIAKTFSSKYWSIQCKFRSVNYDSLTYSELSNFSTLSFVNCKNIVF